MDQSHIPNRPRPADGAGNLPTPARPQLMVFAISGSGFDARMLGARIARWLGPDGSIACWAGDPAPPAMPQAASDSPAAKNLRVMIVSHRAVVFAAALGRLSGASLAVSVTPVTDGARLRERLQADMPQLMLIDEQLLHDLDNRLARLIRERTETMKVLVLCDQLQRCTAECVLARGMHGCLPIEAAPHMWVRAITAVRRGELWLPRAALQHAATAVAPTSPTGPTLRLDALTAREGEAVTLLREGMTNKQIARCLNIGEDTVKKHLQHAFAKLGVHRRALLVLGKVGPCPT